MVGSWKTKSRFLLGRETAHFLRCELLVSGRVDRFQEDPETLRAAEIVLDEKRCPSGLPGSISEGFVLP